MTVKQRVLTLGSRTSPLARWQTNHIVQRLQQAWPGLRCQIVPFTTKGDKILDQPLPQIGGKGLFTSELEEALRGGEIDLAVHSLKDLPTADSSGLTVGAISDRADVRDVLVSKNGWTLATLPQAACVGTSSLRRQAQLLAIRPDLTLRSIRGNVETRIRKVHRGDYDATVLAAAGVQRLGLEQMVSEWLDLGQILPAPGQGALAVQCRVDDPDIHHWLAGVHQANVAAAVTAERAFLSYLGSGCSAPVGAYAWVEPDVLHLQGLVSSPDGRIVIRVTDSGMEPQDLGQQLAQQALAQGATNILAHV